LYGYQIARLLEGNDPEVSIMKQSSLYPVLRSLEENELLASIVEPSVSGPPRRYYTITAEGRTTLKDWIEVWNQTKMFVDVNLKGYSHV
jgi:PadR family transcriptional regulator PadR